LAGRAALACWKTLLTNFGGKQQKAGVNSEFSIRSTVCHGDLIKKKNGVYFVTLAKTPLSD
jgi:hypothetical protein